MSDEIPVVEAFRIMAANKSLSEDELHDLIRDGIHAALAKRFGGPVDAEIDIRPDGDIDIVVLKEVVEEVEDAAREISLEEARWDDPDFQEGDLMEIPVQFEDFGRNAVMAAKQRIIQRVREGERDRIREEYSDRIGDFVTGEVQQIERGKIVVLLSGAREAEAFIPWREQNPRERFRQGDPIRAILKKMEETPRGPRLILSRADPAFVARLFELEVPEIAQGIVEIKVIVREAGGRTKIAVTSRDDSVDPVGACVGLKGSRVQAVVSELSGERIDIVPWHPDPEVFARRALAPADVRKVISDSDRRVITAVVDEDQLSVAIGRNGQNVRLASQLIGWQIDLYSSQDWMERGGEGSLFAGDEYEVADFDLDELGEIAPSTLAALEAVGVTSFFDVLEMETEDFLEVPGIDEDEAEHLTELIDELTVVEDASELPDAAEIPDELQEALEVEASAGPEDEAPEEEAGPAARTDEPEAREIEADEDEEAQAEAAADARPVSVEGEEPDADEASLSAEASASDEEVDDAEADAEEEDGDEEEAEQEIEDESTEEAEPVAEEATRE